MASSITTTTRLASIILIWLCLTSINQNSFFVVNAATAAAAAVTVRQTTTTSESVFEITTSITNYNHCNAKCVTSINTGKRSGCQGFVGDDCSFPYEICPDTVTQCFGPMAVCIGNERGDQTSLGTNYRCDCQAPAYYSIETTTIMEDFWIQDCNDRVTEVCEENQTVSRYAFCTNGGRCAEQVQHGEPHPGCRCPGE